MEQSKIQRAYEMLSQIDCQRSQMVMNLLSKDGEMTVKSVAARLRMSESAASQILASLRKHKLVNFEKEGSFVYYSVNFEGINKINEITAKLAQTPTNTSKTRKIKYLQRETI